jgi:hypothetical protein
VWLGDDKGHVDSMVYIHHGTFGPELASRGGSEIMIFLISHSKTDLESLSIKGFVSKFLGFHVDQTQ